MSQASFLHRQALYLRPDPARVIVRPFKPATEPRDLNPTDKTRANHIVERVLALDPQVTASLLADVLQNFEGRHRNLLQEFEFRADEMEQALSAQRHIDKLNTPLILAHGTYETPEFQRQTRDFYAAVKAAGKPVELIVGEGYNHFEMLETLANPYGLLGRAVLAQMRLSTAA